MSKKNEIQVIKEPLKETKKIETKNLIVYKSGFWSSYSGFITLALLAVVCYLSVVKSSHLLWLLFGIVTMPILRRNYNNITVILFGLVLIVCATVGIILNGVSEMNIASHAITTPMALGIAIFGLFYISFITFSKSIKFIDNLSTILFYLLVLITSYPIFIVCIFVGSLLGFLGVAMLKTIIGLLLVCPILLAIYLIFGNKKKVIK